MNRRFRFLSALFALMAIALFQVEALWASAACALEMEMPVATQTADAETHPGGCAMGQHGQKHDHERQGSQAPDCLLMPAGTASCTGGAALVPLSDEPSVGPAGVESSVASSDHAKDLLLAASLLRPPQA